MSWAQSGRELPILEVVALFVREDYDRETQFIRTRVESRHVGVLGMDGSRDWARREGDAHMSTADVEARALLFQCYEHNQEQVSSGADAPTWGENVLIQVRNCITLSCWHHHAVRVSCFGLIEQTVEFSVTSTDIRVYT